VPGVAEQPRNDRLAARAEAAQELAVDYLHFWSAPNAQALEATPEFYASRVVFHGRMMTDRALLEEKRRFVQRWPEREYRHRENSIRVSCDPSGQACTVQSVFDFTAANSARGKRTQGAATLELVVSFAGDRPVIASENSLVHNRRPSGSNASLEDAADD
jgi:plasmid stabilization system protein ParE